MSAVSLMYQLSAPRLNKEGSFSMFRPSLDELIQEGFGGIVQKKKKKKQRMGTSSSTQYLNNCQDVAMNGPVFFLTRHYFIQTPSQNELSFFLNM